MKTQRELYLEYWGRVHDMCAAYNEKHGTDVNTWECVNCGGPFHSHPKFDAPAELYEFAVAILEGKPVFVGDKLYAKQFLRDYLEDGPRDVKSVQNAAKQAGVSTATLNKAKLAVKVKSKKMGFGSGWEWSLE